MARRNVGGCQIARHVLVFAFTADKTAVEDVDRPTREATFDRGRCRVRKVAWPYRGYFINSAYDSEGWHVTTITHSISGSSLLPPGFRYPGQATAEQYAKAAIDVLL